MIALLFPGQGSQREGMGELPAAVTPELVARARELLGADPFERMAEGTGFLQPALFLTSHASWRSLNGVVPGAVAGHSVGELGALVAAGAMSAETGLELVVERGRLMQEAAERGEGSGMVTVRGAPAADLEDLAAEHGVAVALDNAPRDVVVGGWKGALESFSAAARERGLRTKVLDVPGAFHSPVMEPAVEPFREVLARADLHEPRLPVISNVTGQPFENVRRQLADALVSRVRWRDVVAWLHAHGAGELVEVAPGKVLCGMTRRNLKALEGGEGDGPYSGPVAVRAVEAAA